MTDGEIVALYWARDEEAICQTQRKYGAYLMKAAYNVLFNREDSEEAVNDTYLAAWNSMPENRPERLSTYLGRITRQRAIDVFRRKNSVKRYASEYALSLDEMGDCVSGSGSPEEECDADQLRDAIDRFLRMCSEDERNTFIGRYYFFDPLKDVAAYCGISEGKAKSLLFRTRKSLRTYLTEEGFSV